MEFENLISSFYDLSTDCKEEEIHKEIVRIKSMLDLDLENSNNLTQYSDSDGNIDVSFVKIYHDLLLIEESLAVYLKAKSIN